MSKIAAQTFNFLSIGDRGVGKTVFLLASYTALQQTSRGNKARPISFEFQERQDRDNIEALLKRIAETGQYPPPTLQMTDFAFDVKGRDWRGEKTLCQLRWWDVPGESCQSFDPQFQAVLLKSHGCCLFLDAYELIHNPKYLQTLETITNRAESISSLAHRHQLDYPIAIVLTKCDRLGSGSLGLIKLEEALRPLIKNLEALESSYRCFYSAAPILAFQQPHIFDTQGVAEPLLWLINDARGRRQSQQTLGNSLESVLSNSPTAALRPQLLRRRVRLLAGGVGSLAILTGLFFGVRALIPSPTANLSSDPSIRQYQVILRKDPNDVEALKQLAAEYETRQQYSDAIPLRQRLTQQQPDNVDAWLALASLYLVTNQPDKEEEIYDRILEQAPENLLALTGKAEVYLKRGEIETAKSLYEQAEKSAPPEVRETVRKMAADRLQTATGGAGQPVD